MSVLPVTLACAGVISVFGVNPFVGSDRSCPEGSGRRAACTEKNENLTFERVLVLTEISSCASEAIERVARIPEVGETILLGILDRTGHLGAAWLTGQRSQSPRASAVMRLVAQKKYLETLGRPPEYLSNRQRMVIFQVRSLVRRPVRMCRLWCSSLNPAPGCPGHFWRTVPSARSGTYPMRYPSFPGMPG